MNTMLFVSKDGRYRGRQCPYVGVERPGRRVDPHPSTLAQVSSSRTYGALLPWIYLHILNDHVTRWQWSCHLDI